jgi:hypothetical protein
LKVRGDWPVLDEIETPAENLLTVEEWIHQAAMARDQYVRVVYAGFLFPFGHRASLVKITERKFFYQENPPGYTAYLFQRMYIIVRQRELSYTHRDIPFRSVAIKTRVTPEPGRPDTAGKQRDPSCRAGGILAARNAGIGRIGGFPLPPGGF